MNKLVLSGIRSANLNWIKTYLRLDNTGACAIEVYPSLLCNRVSEDVDLYIKLKLVIFSVM